MTLKYRIKSKFIIVTGILLLTSNAVFAQFVDAPEVTEPANTPAIKSNMQVDQIFNVLIILSALMFVISMFGFGIGFLKMVTSGGDEITAETGSNMLVLSGWIFGASVLSFLVVNVIKYFIY